MKNLLSVELKREIHSPLMWIVACALIVLNVTKIICTNYGYAITATSFLFHNTPFICIALSIFIPLHIGQEFELRTINSKITAGYSRKQIYFTEMIVSILCGLFWLITDVSSILISSKIKNLPLGFAVENIIIECILCFICITSVVAIFTMITMLLHKRLNSIAAALCITILCLHLGGMTVSALLQDEYRIDSNGDPYENVLHIEGFQRTLANTHMVISPFAQAKYQCGILYETPETHAENSLIFEDSAHHWEFTIMNLIEMIAFTGIGISIFKKQGFK